MRRSTALALASLAAAGAAATFAPSAGATDGGRCTQQRDRSRADVIGLTADARLVCFRDNRPERPRQIGTLSGLQGDARLVGIDVRPATGDLYGLGDAGGVYVIDTATAAATKVAQLNVPLQGARFGVDFNPTVDRLRVVSDTGQNLRVNVADGATTADGALNTGPGTTALGIGGAAYTNNDTDPATATTLFDIDTINDQVAIQAPPNAGTLNPTGKLGVDAAGEVGFDIQSIRRDGSGPARSNRAFASIAGADGRTGFYGIDLLTGAATWRGWLGAPVVDIALPLA